MSPNPSVFAAFLSALYVTGGALVLTIGHSHILAFSLTMFGAALVFAMLARVSREVSA